MENIQKVSPDNSVSLNTIYNMDCIEGMKLIPDGSIDCIITDPPYGTTACKRDTIIPFDLMWSELKRIIKPNWAIVLFWSEPFSSALRMSNIKDFRYDIIREKERPTNIFFIKKQIAKVHEIISIFYRKQPTYNPQMEKSLWSNKKLINGNSSKTHNKQIYKSSESYNDKIRYPRSVLKISRNHLSERFHPTQKPVALIEYLIKTYTKENETVLDFTMWSWTCAIACLNTNRNFIWFELDENYWNIANKRIQDSLSEK